MKTSASAASHPAAARVVSLHRHARNGTRKSTRTGYGNQILRWAGWSAPSASAPPTGLAHSPLTRGLIAELDAHDLVLAYQAARAGKLNDRERRAYEQGARLLADLPLLIEEGSELLLSDVASGTRRTAERFEREGRRLGLVVLDHIGFLAPTNRYKGNKVHEVSEITAGLQRLAKSDSSRAGTAPAQSGSGETRRQTPNAGGLAR